MVCETFGWTRGDSLNHSGHQFLNWRLQYATGILLFVSSNLLFRNTIPKRNTTPSGGVPFWWTRGDSNSRPPQCECDALPTALRAQTYLSIILTQPAFVKNNTTNENRFTKVKNLTVKTVRFCVRITRFHGQGKLSSCRRNSPVDCCRHPHKASHSRKNLTVGTVRFCVRITYFHG